VQNQRSIRLELYIIGLIAFETLVTILLAFRH
jgi:hypothetical protein